MRCRDEPAAMHADIIEPHIVGQNNDNIWWSLARALPRAAILPIYRLVRPDRKTNTLGKTDGSDDEAGTIDISHTQRACENKHGGA